MQEEDAKSVSLAKIGPRIVGFAIARFDDYLIWISWVGVIPEMRGKGVAKLLLRQVEKDAVARGCHKVWADSRTDNQAMLRIFPGMGYERVATLANHWYGQDFYIWQKECR